MEVEKLGKGERTRATIEIKAMALASEIGLESITIGTLAKAVGMSKSGLFSHFKSKENLQLAVLRCYHQVYAENVWEPSMKAERGIPRLKTLLNNWLKLIKSNILPGGCLFRSTSYEYDDSEGAVRDLLVEMQDAYFNGLYKVIWRAVKIGHFKEDLDIKQFIFETEGYIQAYHHFDRLLKKPDAEEYLRRSFELLIDRSVP